MPRRLIRAWIGGLVVVATGAGCGLWSHDASPTAAEKLAAAPRRFSSDDPVQRGCALGKDLLARIWRGHDRPHSEDITMVPYKPNYSGAFSVNSHAGPWFYVQNVPLVLYGPGRIRASGRVHGPASLTDVYPTVGRLVGKPLQPRDGRVLQRALVPGRRRPPKLVLVVMWDGAGRNVLRRWPKAWPNLARLERRGTSYLDATVGSSPSITPATHSTLGTGAWPRTHGVTAISYRTSSGKVRGVFAHRNPRDLKLTTFADQIDPAFHNRSRVGMLAWKSWHLGMMGHGAQIPGGDHDELALIGAHGGVSGQDAYYSTPAYLHKLPPVDRYIQRVDRQDGKADGKWLGHDMRDHDNPAWVDYESHDLVSMLRRGRYGRDGVPDLFFTNFKITDIVGHQFTMDSREMQGVLRAQDRGLGRVVRYLDRNVGDYVVVVSADHGHTPSYQRTGAWPILEGELRKDVDAHFGVPHGATLINTTSAVGPFLNHKVMNRLRVGAEDIARFLNGYTIGQNWPKSDLPQGYQDRGDEPVLSAAFPAADYPAIMRCAFGTARVPDSFRA